MENNNNKNALSCSNTKKPMPPAEASNVQKTTLFDRTLLIWFQNTQSDSVINVLEQNRESNLHILAKLHCCKCVVNWLNQSFQLSSCQLQTASTQRLTRRKMLILKVIIYFTCRPCHSLVIIDTDKCDWHSPQVVFGEQLQCEKGCTSVGGLGGQEGTCIFAYPS